MSRLERRLCSQPLRAGDGARSGGTDKTRPGFFVRNLSAGKDESDWHNARVMNRTCAVMGAGLRKNGIGIA
jgi:hypothetical protein